MMTMLLSEIEHEAQEMEIQPVGRLRIVASMALAGALQGFCDQVEPRVRETLADSIAREQCKITHPWAGCEVDW